MPLSDSKTVFITGATSGIGRAVALEFARNGWNILAHYHSSKEKALSLKTDIETIGQSCTIFRADLSKEPDIKSLIKKLDSHSIQSLVNNAGTYVSSRHFTELSMKDLQTTFGVNVFAPILISSALFVQMVEAGFGRIVNISSIAGKYGGSAVSMHYGASKHALEGVTKTLAKEGARKNVLVNTVRPGVIDTDFHKKFPKDMKKRIDMIPARRMGTADEVASMIYYLGSEKNGFVTNEIIAVAGGE